MLLVIMNLTNFPGDLTNASAETESLAHTPPNDDVLEVVVCLTCYQLESNPGVLDPINFTCDNESNYFSG